MFNMHQGLFSVFHIYQLTLSSQQPRVKYYDYPTSQERKWNYKKILAFAQGVTLSKGWN